ncbi:hypothetical protein [Hydrogenophaga defluvii]|uniref:Uncharacterized protein n=1 Tax=Hydrogenophaga defluvii TaxID=249410 RepID=A0ABW2SHK3_9BURK
MTNHQPDEAPETPAFVPCTPSQHASINKIKPERLLALDDGPQGKTALLEFPEGWQRTIALPTQADAWHPMFDDLTKAERDRLCAHVAPPVVRRPDGTRYRKGPLSFITLELNRECKWNGARLFDVPAEDYGAGSITGYRCAGELLSALQRGYGPHIDIRGILDEVTAVQNEPFGRPSRRGAAVAFMEVVKESIVFMAKHGNHSEFLGRRVADSEKYHAYAIEQKAKEKAAFVVRMQAAREAKAAKPEHQPASH